MATYQEQLDKLRQQREAKEKAEAERLAGQLSPKQMKNWREVLVRIVGPYALIMPEAMVQEFRDRFNASLKGSRSGDEQEGPCG